MTDFMGVGFGALLKTYFIRYKINYFLIFFHMDDSVCDKLNRIWIYLSPPVCGYLVGWFLGRFKFLYQVNCQDLLTSIYSKQYST